MDSQSQASTLTVPESVHISPEHFAQNTSQHSLELIQCTAMSSYLVYHRQVQIDKHYCYV